MPKKRRSELVRCTYFVWRLQHRQDVWYADGRSNHPNAGRHSLGTKDRGEALSRLPQLDQTVAETFGLTPPSTSADRPPPRLTLADGRRLYEEHLRRPRATGGVRPSTQKRYRAVFDKFIPFAQSSGTSDWRNVDATFLTKYAARLEKDGYRHKTLINELTTLKQTIRWLIEAGHLAGMDPIRLHLRKAESERAYCWQPQEVAAIVNYCRTHIEVSWVGDVVVALACTGLRISELAGLRWGDIDLQQRLLRLTDETAHGDRNDFGRRQLKSSRSRSFPIHPDLVAVLASLPRKDAFVFHGPRGGRLKPDTVRTVMVRKVIDVLAPQFPSAEGVKGFVEGRLHSFRHYFCSRCADSGVPERMIMEWLGHSDSEMVAHYYHLNNAESRRRMERLDLLGNAGKRITG